MSLLALSELRRAKLRFALLTGTVALLVFLIVFQQGLLGGLLGELNSGLENGDGAVLVFAEDAQGSLLGSVLTPEQRSAVEGADGVGAAGAVGVALLPVDTSAGPDEVTLVGYQLDRPGGPTTLVDGRLPEADGEVVAAISAGAEGFGIGEEVTLEADGAVLTVVGTAEDATLNVTSTLYTSFATFETARLAENPDARAVLPSVLAVDPDDGTDAADLAASLTADVDAVEALERQVAADTAPDIESIQQSFQLIFLLAFVVVTLVVGLSFQIVTAQKVGTLALLRALGRPARQLVGALLFQVVVVVGVGGLLGAGLGLGLFQVVDVGLEVSGDPVTALLTATGVLGLALLAALASARRVWRADPLDATTASGLGA